MPVRSAYNFSEIKLKGRCGMKHTKYISGTEKKNNGFFLLCLAEIAGIITGSCVSVLYADNELLKQSVSPALFGVTLLEIFRHTLASSLIFVITAFFCGLFAFGQVMGIALIVIKGIEIGLSSAFLYAEKGLSAFPAVMVLNVPKAIALSAVAVLAVREMWRSSSALLRFLVSGEHVPEQVSLKLYCLKYIVLIVIIFIISIADSLMNYIFAGLL